MRNVLLFLIGLFMIIRTEVSLGKPIQNKKISLPIAVSQTGRFEITYYSPLTINKNDSLKLTNFMTFQVGSQRKWIIIGAIPGENDLRFVCKHPEFLHNEKISDVTLINDSDINYFSSSQYKGCIINIDKNKSALIIERPNAFINQAGENIKHIGIIGDNNELASLKSNISFQVPAKDFFLNLLQLTQAFSPFSNKIDWDLIENQGLEFIGNETETCRGLSAAAKFLIPELKKQDYHSFVSVNGLGTSSCPAAPIPQDVEIKQWLSVPTKIRNRIIKYSSEFHSYLLNKNITYLYIPAIEAYSTEDINKKIEAGRAALKKAHMVTSCGLIVDLRFNHGGSLQSMLLTLGAVLPSTKLLSLGQDSPIYLSKDGNNLFIGPLNDLYGRYNGKAPKRLANMPVAILTNSFTASSGELTRLALTDNSINSKVFGTETSPTASVNSTFYLLDGNTLNLMVDRVYNNKGIIVPLRLAVDEKHEDNLETIFNPNSDITLQAAQQWLESLSICKLR